MKEFKLSDWVFEEEEKEYGDKFIRFDKVKECIKVIEFDLLKRFKIASIPIMEIIKQRVGDLK